MSTLAILAPVLLYGQAYGWGGGWWWVALLILAVWLVFLPPFGYGRRWYAGRRNIVAPSLEGQRTAPGWQAQWEALAARFVEAPRSAALEADEIVAARLRRDPVPELESRYREAHQILVEDARRKVSTEELRTAMLRFRDLLSDIPARPRAGLT